MNRNQIILIVVPFLLIFGYQNCSKQNFDPVKQNLTGSTAVEPGGAAGKSVISLQDEKIEAIQFKSNEVSSLVKNGNTFSVIKTLVYDFDFLTGDFYVVNQGAQTNSKHCLSLDLKEQLNIILSEASVCKGSALISDGQVCAQVINEGYANIITNREQFHLGSATDSCGANQVDLCVGSDQLKLWFDSVKSKLSSLQCQ